MSKAVVCPVCGSSGKVVVNPNSPFNTAARVYTETCHGCGGLGWVEVDAIYLTRKHMERQKEEPCGD